MTTTVERVETALDDRTYQAFWTVHGDPDVIKAVEGQFESWLRSKGAWDPATEASGFHVGPDGQELLALHHEVAGGPAVRWRLTEATSTGIWRTSITAHAPLIGLPWVGIRVANSERRFASVPRLARYLLEGLELRDGDTWLSSSPRVVRVSDVEAAAEEVCHPDRNGLLLVAATDQSLDFDAFSKKVRRWTQEVGGLAQVIVLDPEASRAFAEIVGPSHAVPPWTIRTFDVDVDPAITGDARRHRILGTNRLAHQSDSATARLLGNIARRHASQRGRPARFTVVNRALRRLEDRLLVDGLFAPPSAPSPSIAEATTTPRGPAELAPPPTTPDPRSIGEEAADYLAQVALVKEIFGIETLDRASLTDFAMRANQADTHREAIDRVTRELHARSERISELEDELSYWIELCDDHEFDLANGQDSERELRDQVRHLQRRLLDLKQDAYEPVPASDITEYPADFEALADRIDDLAEQGVLFTGDKRIVCDLTAHDHLGRIAGVAWECLLSLCEYLQARRSGDWHLGLSEFLKSTPTGYRGVSPGKFAPRETEATMKAFGDERVFPVPTTVNPRGVATMEAHFKLGRIGLISPRMHLLDRAAGDGTIYVGYIGPHLRNTQTN